MVFGRQRIDGSLDLSGVQWCLNHLAEKCIFIRFDGDDVVGEAFVQGMQVMCASVVDPAQASPIVCDCIVGGGATGR